MNLNFANETGESGKKQERKKKRNKIKLKKRTWN